MYYVIYSIKIYDAEEARECKNVPEISTVSGEQVHGSKPKPMSRGSI